MGAGRPPRLLMLEGQSGGLRVFCEEVGEGQVSTKGQGVVWSPRAPNRSSFLLSSSGHFLTKVPGSAGLRGPRVVSGLGSWVAPSLSLSLWGRPLAF
jgi:hypothetical protein